VTTETPGFAAGFRHRLIDLMVWRRALRRFRTDLVDEAPLTRCLDTFCMAPVRVAGRSPVYGT